jgi:hypothetical protein
VISIPKWPHTKDVGRRRITDNCSSYPPIESPLKTYYGQPPPALTHIKLIYLPKNTTPYLQPLDRGLIRSFKAAYRRKYTQHMVQFFEEKDTAAPPLDILPGNFYISEAWRELPDSVIWNCWQHADIILWGQEKDHFMFPDVFD